MIQKHKHPIGVLLINLGTPDSPSPKSVRRYLREFLSDPRVIDLPKIPRWLLLNLVILPFRPYQSSRAYQKIWQTQGSPLLIHSRNLKTALAKNLGDDYHVELGMRYGQPNIEKALDQLLSQTCRKIIVMPLFPQYASASNGSAIAKTLELLKTKWNIPAVEIRSDFFEHPGFIKAYANIIQQELQSFDFDCLLFSYHGLPQRHIAKSQCQHSDHCQLKTPCPIIDINNRFCYRAQCYATSRKIAEYLALNENQYRVSFQSRLGRTPWITPYTDLLLPQLAKQGIKNLAIVSPSFVADCLETLEEIGIRAHRQWQSLGGQNFKLIPCLNNHALWVKALSDLII